jgi:chromosome segregation ATPase
MNEVANNTFDYGQLDKTTSEFLHKKETNMRDIVGKAYTDLGRELKEAQEKLRRQGTTEGVFQKWYESLGFNSKQVSRLLQRYELLTNCQEPQKILIEELPVSLTYEIAKPSANQDLKEKVLDGEVKSLKEYKELEAKLKQAELDADSVKKQLERAESKPPKLIEKVVEVERVVDNTDYDLIAKLRQQLESNEKEKQLLNKKLELQQSDIDEVNKIKQELRDLTSRRDDIERQIDSAMTLSALYVEIENFLQTKLSPVKYSRALTERRDSVVVNENLSGIIGMVETWCREMKGYLPKENYIDAEVISYE